MGKFNKAWCNNCEDLVKYTTSKEDVSEIFRGIQISYKFPISRCVICGNEVSDSHTYAYDKTSIQIAAWEKAKEAKDGNDD